MIENAKKILKEYYEKAEIQSDLRNEIQDFFIKLFPESSISVYADVSYITIHISSNEKEIYLTPEMLKKIGNYLNGPISYEYTVRTRQEVVPYFGAAYDSMGNRVEEYDQEFTVFDGTILAVTVQI